MPRAVKIFALAAAGALVLASVAGGFAYWQAQSLVDEFQAGPKAEVVEAARPELDAVPRRPPTPPQRGAAKTILLIGSDARFGDPVHHADAIMLVRLDPEHGRAALLSVPRDLLVDIPRHGRDRVNAAYTLGGPALLIATVREALGVEIDHFFDVDFIGFMRMVDALGGVYLPVDQRYFNRNVGTPATNFAEIDLRHGYQLLRGGEALAFARYRRTDSDLDRVARQQLFLTAVVRQALGTRFYDLPRVRRLLTALAEATTSDVGDVRTLQRLVEAGRAGASRPPERYTLPVEDAVVGGAQYVVARREGIERSVRRLLGVDAKRPPVREGGGAPAQPSRPLQPDAQARGLLAATGQWVPCVPTALPAGFGWPVEPARAYLLQGHPTAALTARRGPGSALLWMWTRWPDPPALDSPTRTVEREGVTYELTDEGGRVRQVAWRIGEWRVWITNTLRGDVSEETMLRLAQTCRRP